MAHIRIHIKNACMHCTQLTHACKLHVSGGKYKFTGAKTLFFRVHDGSAGYWLSVEHQELSSICGPSTAQPNCSRCGLAMHERPRADVSDGVCWWCPGCKTRKSIKWLLLLLHFWARDYPVTSVAEDVGIDSSTVCDMYQWLREVCSTKLLQTPIILGGQNTIVQIDESLFRHKPKVHMPKRQQKYQYGTVTVQYSMVLVGYRCSTYSVPVQYVFKVLERYFEGIYLQYFEGTIAVVRRYIYSKEPERYFEGQ